MGNQRSCRCKFKTKFILEVPNMFKGIWLWMWEVDRVIFCPVAWSIPFSSGMGLPLLIISRLDWKSSFENCFSLAIKSSIPQKCRRRGTFPSITPTGALCLTCLIWPHVPAWKCQLILTYYDSACWTTSMSNKCAAFCTISVWLKRRIAWGKKYSGYCYWYITHFQLLTKHSLSELKTSPNTCMNLWLSLYPNMDIQ